MAYAAGQLYDIHVVYAHVKFKFIRLESEPFVNRPIYAEETEYDLTVYSAGRDDRAVL